MPLRGCTDPPGAARDRGRSPAAADARQRPDAPEPDPV